MATLSDALLSLRPKSEFTYQNDDYSTIEWHVLDGKAPTQSQVDAEIVRLEALEATKAADNATAKASLLERLNITADEAKLLLS